MKIYDLDGLKLSDRNGTYGGNSGDKEGVLINDEYWIIKYPKKADKLRDVRNMSYTLSPESEYLGSYVYEILGYPVHKTILGIRNNHLVVACKDLCAKEQRLIEFRQLKNTYNKILSEKLDMSLSSTGSDHFVALEEVIIHLAYNPSLQNIDGLKDRFWDCVVIDGFINNNDRNNGNWGILRSPAGDALSPIYDNGSSFSPNVPEYKILTKLNNEAILISSALSNITAYSLDGETNAMYKDILCLDNADLKAAIKRVVPLIEKNKTLINGIIDELPESVDKYQIISKERKAVYKKEMEVRMSKLLLPAYNRIIAEQSVSKSSSEISKNLQDVSAKKKPKSPSYDDGLGR